MADMINVANLVKSFGDVRAVDDVTFSVGQGEIFGLLGPNGAGKTTAIRMMMDILKADSGTIELLGGPLTEASKSRIGYLPEERGLYKGYKVLECLTYLGALKGMPKGDARRRAMGLLDRSGLGDYAERKVKELSKGMAQKAQFLASIVHDPDLLVMDEPFQGLDPVNTEMLKGILLEEQSRGKTVILSTHDMNQVEEMCHRIVLIDHGRVVLYGPLARIKEQYAEHAVVLDCDALPPGLAGVARVEQHDSTYELFLERDTSPQTVLRQVVDSGATVRRFEVATPPLERIFISVVQGAQ